MKRCPECRRDYYDDTLLYCLDDGNALLEGPGSEPKTEIMSSDEATRNLPTDETDRKSSDEVPAGAATGENGGPTAVSRRPTTLLIVCAMIAVAAAIGIGWYRLSKEPARGQIDSIAVMPFVNESGNPDLEYLSDGMTESLINSLARLPKITVKARSSVFQYKGQNIAPEQAASQLSVQAILNGRVIQRGDDLTLFLSLVDGRNGNQIWGEQYNRKVAGLVALQGEIARDVSGKLLARLSGADQQRVAKSYTENAEAYQLYLKGRYQVLKMKPSEIEKGISYFQQAIEIDPLYALAYVGLAEANRAFALSGDMSANEYLPRAKAAAKKAIGLDDTLAEAHAVLGWVILWYDKDWSASERECKRAMELDPNQPDAYLAYAHLLVARGEYAQSAVEVKRARELNPLDLRTAALEASFLIYAGRPDDALSVLRKIFEFDPNFWFAHMWASSAYIEKGMFDEAVNEARKARELSEGGTFPGSFLIYSLAKAGKRAEARTILDEIIKFSEKNYVPPYNIALAYQGLGMREEALRWLEKGYDLHDPKLVFLRAEPKWSGLRGDPKYESLIKKLDLPE